MSEYELGKAIENVIKSMGGLRKIRGIVIAASDGEGVTFQTVGKLTDRARLTSMVMIRNDMIQNDITEVVFDGKEIDL